MMNSNNYGYHSLMSNAKHTMHHANAITNNKTSSSNNNDVVLDDRLEASRLADPFTNIIHMTKIDYLRCFLGTILILPLRTAAVIFVLVLAWLLARICLINVDMESANSRRMLNHGWREKVRRIYSNCGLLCFWAAGFRVVVKGRQCSREEAPILVGAPHSSFLEALAIVMCDSSPVSRQENKNAFLISSCQLIYDTIFVDRRNPESRETVSKEICSRSWSKDPMIPQIFIFPEGTNTNRKKLIQFKRGAFNPGLPVQPVVFRYHGYDKHDAITWTFRQSHSYLFSVWLLLTKPVNSVEIEFLPVHVPDENERKDPVLFAKSVQVKMAEKLGVFPSEDTYFQYLQHERKTNHVRTD